MLGVALEESEDGAEGDARINREFLERYTLFVEQVLVGRVNQLHSSLVVELLEHGEISLGHVLDINQKNYYKIN